MDVERRGAVLARLSGPEATPAVEHLRACRCPHRSGAHTRPEGEGRPLERRRAPAPAPGTWHLPPVCVKDERVVEDFIPDDDPCSCAVDWSPDALLCPYDRALRAPAPTTGKTRHAWVSAGDIVQEVNGSGG